MAAGEAALAKQQELEAMEEQLNALKVEMEEAAEAYQFAATESHAARGNRQALTLQMRSAKTEVAKWQDLIDNAPPVEECRAKLDDAVAAREDAVSI